MNKENEQKFVLRINKDLYQKLKNQSAKENRSINNFIIYQLKKLLNENNTNSGY
jgi:predicted HicB family RNase H-like nuclease